MSKSLWKLSITAFYLWQVSTPTTTWKASDSQLWITTSSGTQEAAISKSSLRYFRDRVSELSAQKSDNTKCSAYAQFQSTFGTRTICEPTLHTDSKAVTLLSRLQKLK
jgi:hypothetical protein